MYYSDELVSCQRDLYNYARFLLKSDTKAWDLLQDTNIAVIEKIDQYNGKSKLIKWAASVMHNLFVDSTRQTKEYPVDNFRFLKNEPKETVRENEIKLFPYVRKLYPKKKEAILLRMLGFNYKEIAERTDGKLNLVKCRIYYAKKDLRLAMR